MCSIPYSQIVSRCHRLSRRFGARRLVARFTLSSTRVIAFCRCRRRLRRRRGHFTVPPARRRIHHASPRRCRGRHERARRAQRRRAVAAEESKLSARHPRQRLVPPRWRHRRRRRASDRRRRTRSRERVETSRDVARETTRDGHEWNGRRREVRLFCFGFVFWSNLTFRYFFFAFFAFSGSK